MVKILPSVLAADFAQLGAQLSAVEAAGADMHHVDIMDGHFVDNISFGPAVIAAIARVATKPLDMHLMLSNPAKYVPLLTQFNPALITFHVEAVADVAALLTHIRQLGIQTGLALKPNTPFALIVPYLPLVDVLLIMSVEPGFGGQVFIPQTRAKIEEAREYLREHQLPTIVEVDGGINRKTAEEVRAAGADWLVAGSEIYHPDQAYATRIATLRGGQKQ